MQRKFNQYKASLLMESLITLMLLSFIVLNYVSFNSHLLQQQAKREEEIVCQRILYEQLKMDRYHNDFTSKVVEQNQKVYKIDYQKAQTKIVGVTISSEGESYQIKEK